MAGPYYNFFLRVFGLPLLLLMGLAPLVAWRRASLRSLGASFAWPAGIAAGVAVVLLALGAGSSPVGLLAYTFSAFVLGSIGYEFVRGTRARRALEGGSRRRAFSSLVGRNRRRYGGYIVHAAIVLLAIGIAGSAYDTVREGRLARGERLEVGGLHAHVPGDDGADERERPRAAGTASTCSATGATSGSSSPGRTSTRSSSRCRRSRRSARDALSLGDLFVILENSNPDGSVRLKALVNPLVNLIWFAGLVFLTGSLIALWPDPAEERRLLERYALAPA